MNRTPGPYAGGARGTLGCGALLVALGLMALPHPAKASPGKNTCEECHSNPDFLVQNKKLYDYYQEWSVSVHRQEDVTCDDCHGGDATASDKKRAHGKGVGAASPSSGVYYKNVPETCGACHSEILAGFRESHHYQHLAKTAKADQGPTCVTCHGSINTEVLTVNSVAAACSRCHNEATGNHPQIPQAAQDILNRFLSIHRYYRYIGIHAKPEEAREFFESLDPQLTKLSVTWHTFVLDDIDRGTAELLSTLRAKRDELRSREAPPD